MPSFQPQNARLRPFRPIPFGRYTLLSPLAMGGMGEIFLARLEGAQGFEKLCVIKKILPQLAQDPEFVERFVNEAKILVKLSHGSIAQVLDVGLHEGDPYMALEYVDGKDVRKLGARARDRNVPLPLTLTLYTMGRVLDALAYAHRKRDDEEQEINLVHRDVSPQNILVSYEGEVKVIDFGLAKSSLSSARTHPSMILGKFLYMSPEQARHQKVDRRSDLYSAGLCLYELVCGKNPFDDVPPHELMMKVANPDIAPIGTVDPLVPAPIQEMLARALELDPARRFQTAEEFRGKLQACLMEIDPSAGPESVSKYMREAFSAEYQQERRLLASLKTIARPTEAPEEEEKAEEKKKETAVFHLKDVAPNEDRARALSEAPAAAARPQVDGKIELAPLSFAPTPRTREDDGRPPQDDATVPGVIVTEELRQAMVGTPTAELKPLATPWEERTGPGRPVPPPALEPAFGSAPPPPSQSPSPSSHEAEPDLDPGTQPAVSLSPEIAAALGVGALPAGPPEDTQPRVVLGTLLADEAQPALPSPQGRVRAPTRVAPVAPDGPPVLDRVPATPPKRAPGMQPITSPQLGAIARSGSSTESELEAVDAPAIAEQDTGVRPNPLLAEAGPKKSHAMGFAVAAIVGLTLATAGWFAWDVFIDVPDAVSPGQVEALPNQPKPILPPPKRPGPPIEPGGRDEAPMVALAVVPQEDAGQKESPADAGAADASVDAGDEAEDAGAPVLGAPDDLLEPLAPPKAKRDPEPRRTSKHASPLVREIKSEWAQTARAFRALQRRHSCEVRQMKLICAQYDLLAPDIEHLPDDEAELEETRAQVRRLRANIQRLAKKWR